MATLGHPHAANILDCHALITIVKEHMGIKAVP